MEKCYGAEMIYERHRHRYEFNNPDLYRKKIRRHHSQQFRSSPVLCAAGHIAHNKQWPDDSLVETVELCGHPFFVGVQFHPEFKSRPNQPPAALLSSVLQGI